MPPLSLDQLIADYCDQNAYSQRLFKRAQEVLPGGNTRTGVFVNPFPVYADQGEGVYIDDVDGNRRLDFGQQRHRPHPGARASLRERCPARTHQ